MCLESYLPTSPLVKIYLGDVGGEAEPEGPWEEECAFPACAMCMS